MLLKWNALFKSKNYKENSNIKTFKEVCKLSPELEKIVDLIICVYLKIIFVNLKIIKILLILMD